MSTAKALFLDRDGVINQDTRYPCQIEEIIFIAGIFEFCQIAQQLGYLLIIVTNQGGIGKGYFTEQQFEMLMQWMRDQFAQRGITLAAIYHCPYHPEGSPFYAHTAGDRKPNPGMLLKAKEDFNLDLNASILIGDRASDIAAAQAAGVGKTIFFNTEPHPDATFSAPSLQHAATWLRWQTHADNLKKYIQTQIPITQAMGITLASVDDKQLILTAPLAPNQNDKQTAFAGTLSALAVLAGWAVTQLTTQVADISAQAVIAGSEMQYLRPITCDMQAICQFPDINQRAEFIQRLHERGKAKWTLSVTIQADAQIAVTFSGTFVAFTHV